MLRDRRVLLVLIVLVALACRAAGAGDALSADEGYSWLVASAAGPDAFLDRLAQYENTPPLFYLLAAPLPLDDEFWIRFPALIGGVASVPVLYAAARPLLGERAALLAALGLAVAPYHVSFSNYSRGFTLATFFLLLALWAVVRLARGGRGRWWWLYALAAVAALYSQYYAALFLLPLLGAAAAARVRPVRELAVFGLAPFLALLPWISQIDRSRDFAGVTKVDPIYPEPSPGAVRDLVVPLFFGEHGSADSAAGRWLELLVVAGLLTAAAILLHRRARRDDGARLALWLLGGTAAGTLALHGFVAMTGPDVFETRYLTALLPLSAALLAGAVDSLPWRAAMPATAAVLVVLGAAVIVQRADRELEPDYEQVSDAVERTRPRAVLTNSGVVAYYLRELPVQLDRPFNLGPGRETRTRPPYTVVDDERVGDGARPGPGRISAVEEVVVRAVASR